MLYFDSESVGLVGPPVLFQWGEGGEVRMEHVWAQPARDTLRFLERLADQGWKGFNVSHDAFCAQRAFTVLRLLPPGEIPTPAGWLRVEREARFGPCLKPRHVLDLWLVAKKGPAQSFMDRDDIYVRKVPEVLADALAQELKERVEIPAAYFARNKGGYEWKVVRDEETPEWSDVVLRWGASSSLGALCAHFGVGEKLDMPIEQPEQAEWDPCRGDWVEHLPKHVEAWRTIGREYAQRDVDLLVGLEKALGNPPPDDDDSVLAASIGICRWRGWSINRALAEEAHSNAMIRASAVETDWHTVLPELRRLAGPIRATVIADTKDTTLEHVAGWGGEAGAYAAQVRDARSAEKEADYVSKLLKAERAHFDFSVIGTLSGRMAGRGGVNPQGAPASLRAIFDLASPYLSLDGGDFDSFEPSIAAAVYDDAKLTLLLQSGKKIHALYGSALLKREHDDVKADEEYYKRSKVAFLGRVYGAQEKKIAEVLGITEAEVIENEAGFMEEFPGIKAERVRVFGKFCSMRQPGGRGTRVEWHEPADYEESLLGFRRYFTLENRLTRALFDLAGNPPREWAMLEGRVQRRKGTIQTPGGAVRSALYGAAFSIQARNLRAAGNHRIQSTGAEICKRLQRRIWDLQPAGANEWRVQPFNVHDEVLGGFAVDCAPVVEEVISSYRSRIPLLKMQWKRGMSSWKEKG